ncbi:MAG: ligand-gated channel protein [Myxococcales bacterium 68-20]|nr:TonB-dependent receptor [Myxococcales bacterium]OJY16118.1 MAG: ligand-gated channel protein [Myxococcales bacterium 68-20]
MGGTALSRTAGSAQVIKKDQLERFEYDDPAATLMQVPGVYVRGEDGVGLRPNLGIRGANPDRSKKLTLMEDGILFGPAPYSAPAAYYFPLVTRMTQMRVIKGPGAIAYGPQTVGGAVDFISRPVPTRTSGAADLAAGQYGYNKVHAWFGSGDDRLGFLVEGVRIQNTGFAELPNGADTGSTRNDWMVKAAYTIDPDAKTKHRLQLKLAYADEVSNETYLGQTDADFRTNPYRRYAASALDQMKNHRTGIVATHTIEGPESSYQLKTSAYRFDYQRTWNKLNRLGGAGAATVLANADDPGYAGYYGVMTGRIDSSGNGADTLYVGPNNRSFVSQGIQSVLSTQTKTGPLEHKLETGIRFHYDHIKRLHTESGYLMQGGQLVPSGEAPLTTSDNFAGTHAVALHMTDAMTWRNLTITPGARVELINSRTEDYQTKENKDALVAAVMPGIGAYYALLPSLGVLAGAYRGFSPPAPGSDSSVKPEYSVNYEAGARYTRGSSRAELIGFYNDYSNLTDVCTLASGCVSTNLDRQFDAGKARIYGLEAFVAHEQRVGAFRVPVSAAYTLTYGEFLNDFTSQDPIYGVVRKGDELPYIPLNQLNVTLAVEHRRAGINGAFNYVAPMREQAGNVAIERAVATDEQVWLDLGGYVNVSRWLRVYTNLRNAFGAENIVGRRPYGARVNAPRWLQVGLKFQF